MKASVYLRVASVLTLIHAILHTVGGVFGKTPPGPASIAKAAMQANSFQVFGVTRTFWQTYQGFGLALTIFLTAEAFVFWQLAPLAGQGVRGVRSILVIFSLAYLVMAVDSYIHFFAAPVVVEAIICVCLAAAAVRVKQPAVVSPAM